MNYEYLKKEFIKLKKEELIYIDNISKISSNKILPEYEKLEFYRGLNNKTVYFLIRGFLYVCPHYKPTFNIYSIR